MLKVGRAAFAAGWGLAAGIYKSLRFVRSVTSQGSASSWRSSRFMSPLRVWPSLKKASADGSMFIGFMATVTSVLVSTGLSLRYSMAGSSSNRSSFLLTQTLNRLWRLAYNMRNAPINWSFSSSPLSCKPDQTFVSQSGF